MILSNIIKSTQMKKFATLALVLIAQINFAQTTKNTGDFDSLKVFDRINVELISSDENKILITGNRAADVEFVNKNGELKVRMALNKLLDGEEIKVKLYFKKLYAIDANEGSFVTSDEIFKQTAISLTCKEGAEIRLKLGVEKLKIRAVSGGIIKIEGSASNQEIAIGTGGILEAEKLETKQTAIKITTGGEAQIRASEYVDAQVRAGGSITIFGSPKQIDKKTVLGGTIIESKR
jgi:hypothetical protein